MKEGLNFFNEEYNSEILLLVCLEVEDLVMVGSNLLNLLPHVTFVIIELCLISYLSFVMKKYCFSRN